MNAKNEIYKDVIVGKKHSWRLIRKLAEGDAGEVFKAEALAHRQPGILKRPYPSAFPTDLTRQVSQLRHEALVLSLLRQHPLHEQVRLPELLDQSREEGGEDRHAFIVLSPAQGIPLTHLSATIPMPSFEALEIDEVFRPQHEIITYALQKWRRLPEPPAYLLLKTMDLLFAFFEIIQHLDIQLMHRKHFGLIWNDVKIDHIYLDPLSWRITLLDWGNAQFLGEDGISVDRQYSWADDYAQFFSSFSHFMSMHAPSLHNQIPWPERTSPPLHYSEHILPVRNHLHHLLVNIEMEFDALYHEEQQLLNNPYPTKDTLEELSRIQEKLLHLGRIPDFQNAEALFRRCAHQYLAQQDHEAFLQLCEKTLQQYKMHVPKNQLIARLAKLLPEAPQTKELLRCALDDEWAKLYSMLVQSPNSRMNEALSSEMVDEIRSLALGAIPKQIPEPLTALKRALFSLKDQRIHQASAQIFGSTLASLPSSDLPNKHGSVTLDLTIEKLEQTILQWTQTHPSPPYSTIEYHDADEVIRLIAPLNPEAEEILQTALALPKERLSAILSAWEDMDFPKVSEGLEALILLDPSRKRLITAKHMLDAVNDWLTKLRIGPFKDESIVEFAARIEVQGREFRRAIAPAPWLEAMIQACALLRKGEDPLTIVKLHPATREYFSWLLNADPYRPLLSSSQDEIKLERKPFSFPSSNLSGVRNSTLGSSEEFRLLQALDTWIPEARGSSARVFLCELPLTNNTRVPGALKILHPKRIAYAAPLFSEEAQVLTLLQNVPGVNPLLECGFIYLDEALSTMLEAEQREALLPPGFFEVRRFGLDAVHRFITEINEGLSQGWLPYLITFYHPQKNNLLYLADTGYTRGRFMPLLEALQMSMQICDLLDAAHARGIVYRDHKILHYYWHPPSNGVLLIDWNIAKRAAQGLTQEEISFDLVQFGARTFFHMLTGHPAPGALPLGPTTLEEIENAPRAFQAEWRYDDQRLPASLKEVTERLLSGAYRSAGALRYDLQQIYNELLELIPPDQEK